MFPHAEWFAEFLSDEAQISRVNREFRAALQPKIRARRRRLIKEKIAELLETLTQAPPPPPTLVRQNAYIQ